MKINEINGVNTQSMKVGMNQVIDSESKSFQNQIASARNQLQKLSADNEMSAEEKEQKRQEIQKQIIELNNELRQHQNELRREQQQAKNVSTEELPGEQQQNTLVESNEQTTDIPSNSVKAIISADAAMEQVKAQENVFLDLESRVRVLEGEIKLDTGRENKAEAKKSELASLENKITKASEAKMNILNSAVQKMKKVLNEENHKDSQSGEVQKKVSNESADTASAASVFAPKNKTDIYKKGKMFSDVDIHI